MKDNINKQIDISMDDITMDENNYDEKTICEFLNYIENETKDCYDLQELYKSYAGLMFSLDPQIGLAVLFSYDYLDKFHNCLCVFFKNKNADLLKDQSYNVLWKITHNTI
jgi:hypothetical protein